MVIDDTLIESLLYEQEGVELDLKSKEYRFAKATDEEKSQLLKDILAFTNAWRRADAFVLIGIQEVKGGRHEVLGISELLDDAAIQQFVNSKTNRPVTFSYGNFSFEGKKIGVIHVPVQQRPIYLLKDYGTLKGKTVYVRQGSSTAIASIDEIVKMGQQPQLECGEPSLQAYFADPTTRTVLPSKRNIKSLVLDTPKSSKIPDYKPERQQPFDVGLYRTNYSYYRQLVGFTSMSRLLSPLYVAIENSGTATAHDVRIELKIDKSGVLVMNSRNYPKIPERGHNAFDVSSRIMPKTLVIHDITVSNIGEYWVVEARADKVQPKATYWFADPFFVGSFESRDITINVTLFSDQLQIPVQQKLFVNVQAEHRNIDLEGILELEFARFEGSPEYQRLVQMHKGKDKE